MAITQPGVKPSQKSAGDEGEESDEYEVPDEEDEEEECNSDDEEDEEDEGGLTAMLLGENPGNYDEEDEGWVPAGGKEPADYSGEEDETENENNPDEPAGLPPTQKSPGKSSNGVVASGGKKRARENDPAEDESREEKKFKLPTDPTL